MASMNKTQRAAHYLTRIQAAENPLDEAQKILAEINTLTWSNTKKPLTKEEKLEIIKEIESLSLPTLDSVKKSYGITEASDNSGILDVIYLLKRGVKD